MQTKLIHIKICLLKEFSWSFNNALAAPTKVSNLKEECIVDIACSQHHSLALTADGKEK